MKLKIKERKEWKIRGVKQRRKERQGGKGKKKVDRKNVERIREE